MTQTNSPLPILPLRDLVLFPDMIVPLFVGREKSVKALEEAGKVNNKLILVAQKDPESDSPSPNELYKIGVVGQILQVLKLNDTTLKVLVEGSEIVKITKFESDDNCIMAHYKSHKLKLPKDDSEIVPLKRSILSMFESYVNLNPKINPEILATVSAIEDIIKFSDIVSSQLMLKVEEKQKILEAKDLVNKLELILSALQLEIELLQTESRIKTRIRHQIEKNQKDYYLNEQLKAIHKELGEEDYKEEIADLTKKVNSLKMTKEAKEKAMTEIKRLKFMNPMSSESTVIRNYIDWLISIPWNLNSALNKDLSKAQMTLDKDHFGLEKMKERIVEYLAVNLKTEQLKSPIICLVGPPGVGKTSLVKSIAHATGREFAKISLGGMRDEAEIKGHRRTYIGALPGRLIQTMKKVKRSNPVLLLDEIDKMSSDYRGDPASAMLEILDPEQNHLFNDHYLEVDYDLSKVMFVATANSIDGIPRPLLDRMEVIRLSGYTEEEKIAIAKNYLVPKQLEAHGASKKEITIHDDVILEIIRYHTRESGVRGLDRNIAKIMRKAVKELLIDTKEKSITINKEDTVKYLGVHRYTYGEIEANDQVGVTTGLAYSEVGGDLLSIESVLMYGKGGEIKITGKLGEVMKESAQTALSFIRSRSTEFGIKPSIFKAKDIHIHVPEGATPKDGPSAGIAIATSLVSVLSGIAVKKDIAMTGEITLRGKVLPIGGLKEKLLAALRGGVKTVLIPVDNVKDLEEIPQNAKEGLQIIPVTTVREVFAHALVAPFTPINWHDDDDSYSKHAPTELEGTLPH